MLKYVEWRFGIKSNLPAAFAGRLQGRLQKVRVSPYTTHVPLRTVSKGMGEVTSPVMSPLRSPDSDPQIATQAKAAAQLDVNIEYNADCPRGSSSRLTLAVLPSIRYCTYVQSVLHMAQAAVE